jgi:integrase
MKTQKQVEVTLSALGKRFWEYGSVFHTTRTLETYMTALQEFIRIVGDLPIRSVGVFEIERFLGTKTVEASAWTARKYYIALRAIFRKAVEWNYLIENPFCRVSKPQTPEPQPVYFTGEDFRLLLSVIDDRNIRDLSIMALLTGMRLGELLALRWEDVDFGAKVIRVRNSKTLITEKKYITIQNKKRVVPMDEKVYQVMKQRREDAVAESLRESSLVFYGTRGEPLDQKRVSKKFKKYIQAAGLNDKLLFRNLRYSHLAAWDCGEVGKCLRGFISENIPTKIRDAYNGIQLN